MVRLAALVVFIIASTDIKLSRHKNSVLSEDARRCQAPTTFFTKGPGYSTVDDWSLSLKPDSSRDRETRLASVLAATFLFDFAPLFFSSKVNSQRCIRQMSVIILRAWTDQRTLIVVVVLVPKIPIQMAVDLNRQPAFR